MLGVRANKLESNVNIIIGLITIVVNILAIGFSVGRTETVIKFLEEQIHRLELKQDKHNNLIERMAIVEESSKSAHHRIDEIKK